MQADGLIQRVTTYEDYDYTIPIQSYENYLNRSDCFTESRRDFRTNTVTDYFTKGRSDHCKSMKYEICFMKSILNIIIKKGKFLQT